MSDTLTVSHDSVTLITEEGARVQRSVVDLEEMYRRQFVPPLNGAALPDGVKFVHWQDPRLVVVHQTSPCVRRCRWIAADSPAPFGAAATYRHVELSLPYAVTFAIYEAKGGLLTLSGANELYFTTQPLRSRQDRLCYPALLNVSKVKRQERVATWICTQYLKRPPGADWVAQLDALLKHTFDGGFNYSSEHHEGASWYGESKSIAGLHPVEKWVELSKLDPAWALTVHWLPAPLTVGELIEELLTAQPCPNAAVPAPAAVGLFTRFLNFVQSKGAG